MAASHHRHSMNDGVEGSVMGLRWTARIVAQTKRQMYSFLHCPDSSRYHRCPVWSTPTAEKGSTHFTLSLGSSGGKGLVNIFPFILRQMMHLKNEEILCGVVFWESRLAV